MVVEVFLQDENIWLTQEQISKLFGKAKSTINEHIKNIYLEQELKILNRMVSAYLDIAEINALNREPMTMQDWINELDTLLKMTRKDILKNNGKISHEKALKKSS